jgi:alkanesulfonate monooxygenase SsuD/methylene tetrahydromethanopterin reductase-like flavin-dependent oxidoreductase (luciferase family)
MAGDQPEGEEGNAMKVGIGLPNAVRGVNRAGRAGFASLGTLDRLVYANYESLIALAAATAVTERIELVTDILIAPLRSNTALFAKQAATIDSLSGGRLTLGLAPGGRRDDFEASGVGFSRRGRIFERQLDEMTAVWRGERGIGPAPRRDGRPGLLIGGRADVAYQRAATYADGWTIGGGPPAMVTQALGKLTAAWSAAGRVGRPRTMALFYFALGQDAEKMASDSLGHYYAFLGDYAQQVVASAATDADTVRHYLAGFEAAGTDDVICFPASADVSQIDRLAEAAL